METISAINSEMLSWARQESNVTHQRIVQTMGDDRYILWEKGDTYPTFFQLEKLMKLFNFPVAVAFFSEPPEYTSPKVNFRTIPKDVINNLDYKNIRLIKKARAFQISLEYMLDKSGKSESNTLENLSMMNDNGELIKSIRNIPLNLSDFEGRKRTPKQFFDFWRDELYENGIYVFKDSFKDDSISGFSLYHEKYPVIYVNNTMSFTRQNFTLFHELYHLVYKTNGIDFTFDSLLTEYDYDLEVEYSCNGFAGEFLISKDFIKETFTTAEISVEMINDISTRIYASRDVLLRRLFDLGYVSPTFYYDNLDKFKNDFMRNKDKNDGKGGNYYNNQMSYLGQKYLELSFGLYYESKLSLVELSNVTNMTYNSLKEITYRKHWREL